MWERFLEKVLLVPFAIEPGEAIPRLGLDDGWGNYVEVLTRGIGGAGAFLIFGTREK